METPSPSLRYTPSSRTLLTPSPAAVDVRSPTSRPASSAAGERKTPSPKINHAQKDAFKSLCTPFRSIANLDPTLPRPRAVKPVNSDPSPSPESFESLRPSSGVTDSPFSSSSSLLASPSPSPTSNFHPNSQAFLDPRYQGKRNQDEKSSPKQTFPERIAQERRNSNVFDPLGLLISMADGFKKNPPTEVDLQFYEDMIPSVKAKDPQKAKDMLSLINVMRSALNKSE